MMTEHENKKHERTCVGCGKAAPANELVRLVLNPAGVQGGREAPHAEAEGAQATPAEGGARGAEPLVVIDAGGGKFGRGAHVHAARACIEKACKSGLSRAFKKEVKADPKELAANIRDAFERRAIGLILGARRAGHLSIGSNEVTASAPFVVVAADAGSIAGKFERAIHEGRAAVFGTKAGLGKMFGRGETAVFAVNHEGVARALQEALAITGEAEER